MEIPFDKYGTHCCTLRINTGHLNLLQSTLGRDDASDDENTSMPALLNESAHHIRFNHAYNEDSRLKEATLEHGVVYRTS
jgi:hypothetical protein